MNDDQLVRYARHIHLDEIGIEGQALINQAGIAVVGVGGLGCIVSLLLATAGVRRIVLIDDDAVEVSNLQRQILYRSRMTGAPKVECAAQELLAANPYTEVVPVALRADGSNPMWASYLGGVQLVMDCTDNFASRRHLSGMCRKLGLPLLVAGVDGFEGFAAGFHFGRSASPCYECVFPCTEEHPPVSCATYGVFSPAVQIAGSLAASKALSLLSGARITPFETLDWFDLEEPAFNRHATTHNPGCPACGGAAC